MTLDAMDWVWKHSQSKGNARLALLYVADQVRTQACEVRVPASEFMDALNASKNTVKAAIREAEESGELETVEPAAGRRPALYRLPKAVGYIKITSRRGSEVDPLEGGPENRRGSEVDPLDVRRGSEVDPLRNLDPMPRGSEVDPLQDRRGSKVDPPLPTTPRELREGSGDRYPEQVLPLVHAMSASDLNVRWPFQGNEWFPLIALIKKCGVRAMVEHAHRAAANARTPVTSARYFLAGWGELPPAPPEDTPVYRPTPGPATGRYVSPEDRGIF